MFQLVNSVHCLTSEELDLFSYAAKASVSVHRDRWKLYATFCSQEAQLSHHSLVKQIKGFCDKEAQEIERICKDVLTIIENELLPNSDTTQKKVIYLKLFAFIKII